MKQIFAADRFVRDFSLIYGLISHKRQTALSMKNNNTKQEKNETDGKILQENYTKALLENFAENQAAVRLTLIDDRTIDLSGAEVRAQIRSFADYLNHLKVGKGKVVAGICQDLPERIFAILATHSLGGKWLEISTAATASEVETLMKMYRPHAVVTMETLPGNPGFSKKINKAFDEIDEMRGVVVLPSSPPKPGAIEYGRYWNDTYSVMPQPFVFPDYAPDEVIFETADRRYTHRDFLQKNAAKDDLYFLKMAEGKLLKIGEWENEGILGFVKRWFG